MNEYIIVGDTEKYTGCLVRLCGTSYSRAQEILAETKATGWDGFIDSSFRIEEVEEKDCWWNDSVLCN